MTRFALALLLFALPASAASTPCNQLKHLLIPASAIALPTRGAVVKSAALKHSGTAEFCEVKGEITSVSASAQAIRFQVNLPVAWNGKAVHYGGGGFDGSLVAADGLRTPAAGIKRDPTPLQRGFATFGSDSGHHHHYLFLPDIYNELKARFAPDPEMRLNFAHDGLKKTHDAVVAVMQAHYGKAPTRMFFLGGSTGGREAYFVTQLWPTDYDGVLGAYAGWNQVQLDLEFIRLSQAEYRKGDKDTRGWLPKSKTGLVAKRVMQACDAADGLADGIISNPAGCNFDLATLACPAGQDHKDCLTTGQMQTFQTFAREQRTEIPLAHAVQTLPEFNVTRGTNLTGSMGLVRHAFHDPAYPLGSFYYQVGSSVLRFFLTGDPNYNLFDFNTMTGGKFHDELMPQSVASDASDADLTPYARHGGKLILIHGTADATIPTGATVEFYKMMQGKMSQETIDSFARIYLIPGFGHGHGVFDAGFDALTILDQWVDGHAPQRVVATDNNKGSGGRTRPLCVYPTWPRYNAGDAKLAASFSCVE